MIFKRIGLGLLALIIGAVGVFVFGVVSLLLVSGYTSGFWLSLAFLASTLIYAVPAYRLRLADFEWSHIYALMMCTPLLLLCVVGALNGSANWLLALAALLMTAIVVAVALQPPGAHTGAGKASR